MTGFCYTYARSMYFVVFVKYSTNKINKCILIIAHSIINLPVAFYMHYLQFHCYNLLVS